MKKQLYSILLLAVLILATSMAGCEKGPLNGNLDNMWQVMTIEDFDDGTKIHPEAMYYCIYREEIQLRAVGASLQTGVLTYKDGILTVDFPLAKAGELDLWDISGTSETYEVELGSEHMTLRSKTALLELRKF